MVCSTMKLLMIYYIPLYDRVDCTETNWMVLFLCFVHFFSFNQGQEWNYFIDRGFLFWDVQHYVKQLEESVLLPVIYFIRHLFNYSWCHKLSHSQSNKGSVNIYSQGGRWMVWRLLTQFGVYGKENTLWIENMANSFTVIFFKEYSLYSMHLFHGLHQNKTKQQQKQVLFIG